MQQAAQVGARAGAVGYHPELGISSSNLGARQAPRGRAAHVVIDQVCVWISRQPPTP
ncbi:hypothetical protein [Nonomuraea dietziae]|uniref:hypothetical protein n=1 Tax=Nonomuraea dietziae TaxID=65515 RepID=UPI0031E40018